MNNLIKNLYWILTHPGQFHADDVLYCAWLLGHLLGWPKKFQIIPPNLITRRGRIGAGHMLGHDLAFYAYDADRTITQAQKKSDESPLVAVSRSRNPEVFKVVKEVGGYIGDVGGECDGDPESPLYETMAANRRLCDHHQGTLMIDQRLVEADGSTSASCCDYDVEYFELSSFGLLFRNEAEGGYPGLRSYLASAPKDEVSTSTKETFMHLGLVDQLDLLKQCGARIRTKLVFRVDGMDTGTWPVDEVGIEYVYTIQNVLSGYNPTNLTPEASNEAFGLAVQRAYEILRNLLRYTVKEVADSFRLKEVMTSAGAGRVLVLDSPLNWGKLPEIDGGQFLFVVFPTTEEPSDDREWMLQCVPTKVGSFETRKPLPANWAGLRGEELAEVNGVPGAIFTHKGLWIGGAKDKEGAVKMADIALDTSSIAD